MGRIRCPMCEQSIEEGIAVCTFCGHLFDPKRAALEEAEQMRRTTEAAAARRGIGAPANWPRYADLPLTYHPVPDIA